MDCSGTEDLLALFVGGDLDESETLAVSAHLAACATCAESATRLRESIELIRRETEPEVDGAFYESIRRDVLATLAAPAPSERRWSIGVAASVALVALGLLFVVLAMRAQPASDRDETARDDRPPSVEPPSPPREPETDAPSPRRATRHRADPRRHIAPRRAPRAAELPAECVAAAEPLKLEFQTSDPNIRIIWFVPNEDGASSTHTKNTR